MNGRYPNDFVGGSRPLHHRSHLVVGDQTQEERPMSISKASKRRSEISRLHGSLCERLNLNPVAQGLVVYENVATAKPYRAKVGEKVAYMNAAEAHAFLMGADEALEIAVGNLRRWES